MYDFKSRPAKDEPATSSLRTPTPKLPRRSSTGPTLDPARQAPAWQAAQGPVTDGLFKALEGVTKFDSPAAKTLTSAFIATGATSELREKLQKVVDKLMENGDPATKAKPNSQPASRLTTLCIKVLPGDNKGNTVRTSLTDLTISVLTDHPDSPIALAILADELYTAYQLLVTHQIQHYSKKEGGSGEKEKQNDAGDWGTRGYDALDELETKIASLLTLRNIKGKDLQLDEYLLPGHRNASIKAMKLVLEAVRELEQMPGSVISVDSVRQRLLKTRQGGFITEVISAETAQEKKTAASYKSIRDFASDKFGYGLDLDIMYNTPQYLGRNLAPNPKHPEERGKELETSAQTKESFDTPGDFYLKDYYRELFTVAKKLDAERLQKKESADRFDFIRTRLKNQEMSDRFDFIKEQLSQPVLTKAQLEALVDKEMKQVVKTKMEYRFPTWDF